MEGEYQKPINKVGRATLDAFQAISLGTVVAESGLTPARALLDRRQTRFTQRLYARPRDGDGPEENLTRERAALTMRLRTVASVRPGETVETKERGLFPGKAAAEERAGALRTANEWRRRDTVWTGGSRLDSEGVGAACVWQRPGGCSGRRFHLGTNKEKEVFDAQVCAICQALCVLGQRQESGHQFTAAIRLHGRNQRSKGRRLRPRPALNIATMEVFSGVFSRDNEFLRDTWVGCIVPGGGQGGRGGRAGTALDCIFFCLSLCFYFLYFPFLFFFSVRREP